MPRSRRPARTTDAEKRTVHPPRERSQHDTIEVGERTAPDGGVAFGARITTQRHLDRYLSRSLITPEQFAACIRLYKSWRAAGREPKITADHFQKVARGTGDSAQHREDARRAFAFQQAMKALPGVFVSVITSVVLLDESAGEWAVANRKSRNAGVNYLADGLELVHEHFEAQHRARIAQTSSSWGPGDMRGMRALTL